MIQSYGAADDTFRRYLDRLIDASEIEQTQNGFEYYVADPELIRINSGIVGISTSTPDTVEMGLVLGEDIPEHTRRAMVDICCESTAIAGRYAVAQACHNIVSDLDPKELPDLAHHIGENLAAHRRGISRLDRRGNYRETHPLTRLTLQSALGWLHIARPLSAKEQENLDRLRQRGLDIPPMQSGQRLAGYLRSRQGSQPVGLVRSTERSERHKCPPCSGQILAGTTKVTVQLDTPKGHINHHNMHASCAFGKVLGDLDPKTLRYEANPHFSGPRYKRR